MSWPLFELTDNVKITFLGITPTNPQLKIVLIVKDYGLKGIIRKNKGRARDALPFHFSYWLFQFIL